MRPPAFIVMPFGVKEFEHHDSAGSMKAVRIDFTRVCDELLEPFAQHPHRIEPGGQRIPCLRSRQRASDLSRSIGSRVPARSFAARIRSAVSP